MPTSLARDPESEFKQHGAFATGCRRQTSARTTPTEPAPTVPSAVLQRRRQPAARNRRTLATRPPHNGHATSTTPRPQSACSVTRDIGHAPRPPRLGSSARTPSQMRTGGRTVPCHISSASDHPGDVSVADRQLRRPWISDRVRRSGGQLFERRSSLEKTTDAVNRAAVGAARLLEHAEGLVLKSAEGATYRSRCRRLQSHSGRDRMCICDGHRQRA